MITEENKQKIMNAVRDILEAVGEDVTLLIKENLK